MIPCAGELYLVTKWHSQTLTTDKMIDYDVLTPGNHELYISEITYEHFYNFSQRYGDRYVSSNVQVLNPATSEFEYMGVTHRYFTTDHGLRIMAFGVLFNFTGNSNASRVIPAAEMVTQQWFQDAITCDEAVDLYLLIGHNPARPTVASSTFATVYNAIRAEKPDTPIQIFGGHNHIRDFAVYDDKTTALGSGRYCETLGWLSMDGIESDTYNGTIQPVGVPNPTTKAVKINATTDGNDTYAISTNSSGLTYSRRYLDWNRITFEYHATGSQIKSFDTTRGLNTTQDIYDLRHDLNLTKLYGCAPQTWCVNCVPFLSNGSIYSLLQKLSQQSSSMGREQRIAASSFRTLAASDLTFPKAHSHSMTASSCLRSRTLSSIFRTFHTSSLARSSASSTTAASSRSALLRPATSDSTTLRLNPVGTIALIQASSMTTVRRCARSVK